MINTFSTKLLTFAESKVNPLFRTVSFVFTDFEANVNNEAVPRDEIGNILSTIAFTPLKIFFTGERPVGHPFSSPIGVIASAEYDESTDRIIATGYLWQLEAEDVIDWLTTSYANGDSVHFSWELSHNPDLSYVERGVRYLKNIAVAAATIVDKPAYQGRTPLLSFAEDTVSQEIVTMDMEPVEIETVTEEVVSEAEDVVTEDVVTDTVDPVLAELEELRAFKQSIEAKEKRETALASLKNRFSAGGFSALLTDARIEWYLSMSEEALGFYLSDLQTVADMFKNVKAEASERPLDVVPEPFTSGHSTKFDPKELGRKLRANS